MKIKKDYPPNIEQIKAVIPVKPDTIFAFGDIIYSPSGKEIPEDIIIHEAIHERQQKSFTTPQAWWSKYLTDLDFRRDQEVEAYYAQWQFVKKTLGADAAKGCLDECSENLSDMYSLNIDFHKAHSLIRHFLP